ncbi:hypothetical protein HK099_003312 [Clydaea vesicula]|uniref:NADH:ubiquinone oxidoreductase intermediate-associated protein 30 domain-containing protein n=1 Tax=Clydaea vesicula TaxID=447962 RepID=A0AAD5U254_9FUNG|nr:hypothetical protein HK099_003312 [Clydaea vesicula]
MSNLRFLTSYFQRSLNYVKDATMEAIRMDMSWKREMPLLSCNSIENLQEWVVGSDADIGGNSEAYWGLTKSKHGIFWGTLSQEIPKGSNIKHSGYAGFRSKERPITMFHRPRFDCERFRYLYMRLKGDNKQWFVNIQTDSLFPTYLYQHRLVFKTPGEWETIMIPFRDFVLTSEGFVQPRQIVMDRSKIRTFGFSVVRQDGDFCLEIDYLKAFNTPNTFGDRDILGAGEYIDEKGNICNIRERDGEEKFKRLYEFSQGENNQMEDINKKKKQIKVIDLESEFKKKIGAGIPFDKIYTGDENKDRLLKKGLPNELTSEIKNKGEDELEKLLQMVLNSKYLFPRYWESL